MDRLFRVHGMRPHDDAKRRQEVCPKSLGDRVPRSRNEGPR